MSDNQTTIQVHPCWALLHADARARWLQWFCRLWRGEPICRQLRSGMPAVVPRHRSHAIATGAREPTEFRPTCQPTNTFEMARGGTALQDLVRWPLTSYPVSTTDKGPCRPGRVARGKR